MVLGLGLGLGLGLACRACRACRAQSQRVGAAHLDVGKVKSVKSFNYTVGKETKLVR